MNHGLKMMVNPMERWQTEGQSCKVALNEAKKLDPENPRISILEAEDLYYTPEQFGGSKSKGIELFKKALEQFKTYKIKSSVDPNWGQGSELFYLSGKINYQLDFSTLFAFQTQKGFLFLYFFDTPTSLRSATPLKEGTLENTVQYKKITVR
jgi:hypothetical protein